ncbi:MAG: Ig-like domain-containing protein [Syntrophaceticus schinkii]
MWLIIGNSIQAACAQGNPEVTVTGNKIEISGDGLAPGSQVTLLVTDSKGNRQYIDQVTADSQGAYKFTFALAKEGSYTAKINTGTEVITLGFVVESGTIVPVTGVSLDKTSLTLTTGKSGTLTATVAPANASNKAVTWASDNTSVATVDQNGKVTAVSAGTATITVTTVDGSKTATCTVTVEDEIVTVPVTGVSLDKTSLTLTTGKSDTLTATVAPANASNKAVSWASSNTSVATVDQNGKVTAVSAGTATITVTTVDGSKTATCTVTVEDEIVTVPVTGVSLDKTSLTLTTGKSDTLTATVAPANASNKAVSWASSNTSVATVDQNGKVTAVSAGTATITVTTVDGSKTATCSVTVELKKAITEITGEPTDSGGYEAVLDKDSIQSENVLINMGNISVNFPAEVLESLTNQGTIELVMRPCTEEEMKEIKGKLPEGNAILFSFDLHLQQDGKEIHQLGGSVKVTVKLTKEMLAQITDVQSARLYYYNPITNSFEDMNAVFDLQNNTVTFYTDHLSNYVIVQKQAEAPYVKEPKETQPTKDKDGKDSANLPKTGGFDSLALLMVGAVMGLAGIIVLKRKRPN